MKIAGTNHILSVYKTIAQPTKLPGEIAPQQKDTLVMSSNAQSFSEVMRQAKSELTRSTSKERLDSIQQRVQTGTYSVDSRELAGSILVNMEM